MINEVEQAVSSGVLRLEEANTEHGQGYKVLVSTDGRYRFKRERLGWRQGWRWSFDWPDSGIRGWHHGCAETLQQAIQAMEVHRQEWRDLNE